MDAYRQRLRSFFVHHFYRFERWRWIGIAILALSLTAGEIYEYYRFPTAGLSFHLFEGILYLSLILGVGLFMELFVRLNRIHKRMVKILEYKHNLSLEFSLINDWESLTRQLVRLPGKIAEVDEAYFLINNPVTGKFEPIAHWVVQGRASATGPWDPTIPCEKCSEPRSTPRDHIHLCRNESDPSSDSAYSLRIENSRTALLKFRLPPSQQLSTDERKVFNNIVDEIGVALHAVEDHIRISELQSAEVAMAERRMMSAYVHDQVGQNLGYLHLKLDQLTTNEYLMRSKELRKEVEHLREIANESYEIVRDILKKIQPETVPNLTNLLKEHANRVARTAHFNLSFRCTGAAIQFAPEVQQSIFYAFHEVFSNVEKHSRASKVEVLVTWSREFLDITVGDNGIGFDPKSVRKDEHFGLEILQDRMTQLAGQLLIDSSLQTGTVVSLSVPIPPNMRVPNEQTGKIYTEDFGR